MTKNRSPESPEAVDVMSVIANVSAYFHRLKRKVKRPEDRAVIAAYLKTHAELILND